MSLNLIRTLVERLRRGATSRQRFVESHLAKGIASQIRATRDKLGWSQTELADKVSMNQNAISRLESWEYGKPTITTLRRLAAAFDVGLIVRFVPFSEMVHWVSGTSYVNKGLSTGSLEVPTFTDEEEEHVFDMMLGQFESVSGSVNFSELIRANPEKETLLSWNLGGSNLYRQGAGEEPGSTKNFISTLEHPLVKERSFNPTNYGSMPKVLEAVEGG